MYKTILGGISTIGVGDVQHVANYLHLESSVVVAVGDVGKVVHELRELDLRSVSVAYPQQGQHTREGCVIARTGGCAMRRRSNHNTGREYSGCPNH